MTRSRHSMDGFIPRRPRADAPTNRYERSGDQTGFVRRTSVEDSKQKSLPGAHEDPTPGLAPSSLSGLSRADIDESLREIDESPAPEKKRRRFRLGRPRSLKRVIKWVVIGITLILVGVGGWLGYKGLDSIGNISKGNILGLLQKKPLKQDANGRSNVLIFGTSADSDDHNANGGEGGPLLTDSMMVLSVNQEKKDAFIVSLPRDLWVKFDEPCLVGYQEKLNSVYQCGSDFGENQEAGAAALQKKVGEILGLDIQYYAQIDYSVVTRAVDAVGGVDVTIESNPPGMGILDRNFDWKCNYQCYYVKYDDGETVHLDGEHAMMLSRARNAQGGYGLAAGNFDREKNQQKILKALREKALSVGTLTNVGAVSELMSAMGDNLKTSVDTSEIQTIISLAGEIQSESIMSLSLNDEENPLVTTGAVGAASVVRPIAGLFDYSDIQAFIRKASTMDAASKEGAVITVLNGSGTPGAAQKEADWLEDQNFSIGEVGNAPEGDYPETKIYQRNQAMSASKAKLASLYGVSVETASPMPIAEDVDFVVIIGQNNPSREQ